MKSGLLGRKLAHSYSPQIHSYLGDYSYELFEKEPEELDSFFENMEFDCINVTIPYKKDVMPYCSELTECAKKMKSFILDGKFTRYMAKRLSEIRISMVMHISLLM